MARLIDELYEKRRGDFAVILGCSDSRLAAEIIFDRGLGDLFVVRTAGHTAGHASGHGAGCQCL